MRALLAPVEAIFLDAMFESELAELDDDEAAKMLEMSEQDEAGLDQLARGLLHAQAADVPHRRTQGVAGLGDLAGGDRARGGRRYPLRLPEGFHLGRDRVFRGPRSARLDGRCPRRRPRARGGQGLRHGRW